MCLKLVSGEKKIMTFLINPNFLCRSLTGIERFSLEICKCLDKILSDDDDFRILIPSNAKIIPQYQKIKIIKLDYPITSFPKWDLFDFAKECKKNHATGINFSNTAPLGKNCGIAFIHDIYPKLFPEDFKGKKNRLIRLYSSLNYKNITKNAKKVLTVSEFSKNQIAKTYKIDPDKIAVIPNGWDHFKNIQPDNSILEKSNLHEKSFYFTLGSLQKRKNLKWIASYAKNHPDEIFAISGKVVSGYESDDISNLETLKNVHLLGYLSDGQIKALMQKCKAFIFPSYYEGFGIPPLEALSAGAQIVISNATCLPEIFGKTAHYINPDDPNVDLEKILQERLEPDQKVLDYYTYENAAKKFYEVLKKDL